MFTSKLSVCPGPHHGFNICTSPIKLLGSYLGHDKVNNYDLNFNQRVRKMNDKLDIWRSRDLTLRGKTLLIKSHGISQFIYNMSALSTPEETINKAQSSLINFLWDKKRPKIKYSTVIADKNQGGLGIPDLSTLNKALKLKWIPLLLYSQKKTCTIPNFYFKKFGGLEFLLKCNYRTDKLNCTLPPFYRTILQAWSDISPFKKHCTLNAQEVANQKIWNNQHILVAGTSVFYQDWFRQSINFV